MNGFATQVEPFATATQLSEFMLANIRYADEQQRQLSAEHGYRWKTPEETLRDGYGFCYDLSAFALYGLKSNGYTTARLLFCCWGKWGQESGAGHFVCVFRDAGRLFIIDNGYLKGPLGSLKAVIDHAANGRPVQSTVVLQQQQIPFHSTYRELGYLTSTFKQGAA